MILNISICRVVLKMRAGLTTACLMICFFVQAQNECQTALYDADKLYQKGQMSEAIKLLEPCLQKNLSKEQRFETVRLLGLLYLLENNETKLEECVQMLLQLRPDYQQHPNMDPPEFTKFVKKFEVRPLWSVGIGAGYNSTAATLIKSHSAFATPQRYMPTSGYQFGGFVEYGINAAFSARFNLMMNGIFVKHQLDSAGGWKQTYEESQRYALYQLSANYQKRIYKNFSGRISLGIGLNSLLKSMVYFESENLETQSIQLATKNALPERIIHQPIASAGLGFLYKISKGVLGLDVSYFHFFNNTVDPSKRMNDLNFIMNNQYVNDDIRLRSLQVNISYKIPLGWHIKYKKGG